MAAVAVAVAAVATASVVDSTSQVDRRSVNNKEKAQQGCTATSSLSPTTILLHRDGINMVVVDDGST